MRGRQESKTDRTSFKALLWTALAALIFGLTGAGDIAEDLLRTTRNSLHWHKASGDIVLIKIDDESLRTVGRWPWPRRRHAEMIDALRVFTSEFEGMVRGGTDGATMVRDTNAKIDALAA